MTKNELKKILTLHKLWLNDSTKGKKADLAYAILTGADLTRAKLTDADLTNADLAYADLTGADLTRADLAYAVLTGAKILYFRYNKHTAYYTYTDNISIGCQTSSIKQWKKEYKKIGKSEGYTKDEIEMYGAFIKMCEKKRKIK